MSDIDDLGIDPHQVYRPHTVQKKFVPLGDTQFQQFLRDAVAAGLITLFPVIPGGRAVGMTGADVIKLHRLRLADAAARVEERRKVNLEEVTA